MNMSKIKQVGYYKEKVAELKRELNYKEDRLRWYMTETRALNSKLDVIRWSTSYTKLQELEGLITILKNRCEGQGKLLVGFYIYSVIATIGLITLAILIM